MKRREHILKPYKKQWVPRHCLFLDTESYQERETSQSEEISRHTFRLGCLDHVILDGPASPLGICCYANRDELWGAIKQCLNKRHTTWIFAHNAQFDLTMLNFWERIKNKEVTISSYHVHDIPYFLSGEVDGKRFKIVDSMNYCPSKLEEIAESLNLCYVRLPDNDAHDSQFEERCVNDVYILREFMLRIIRRFRDDKCGTFGVSMAANAFACFRNLHLTDRIQIHDDAETLELERLAYHGGDTIAFQSGHSDEPHYLLDVNGLFPYVMYQKCYPYRRIITREADIAQTQKAISNGYGVIADVYIDSPHIAYKMRELDGTPRLARGTFRTQLCGEELDTALRMGHVKKVYRYSSYLMSGIFRDFVSYWSREKGLARESGDVARADYASLMMKSLSGKFAQRKTLLRPVDFVTATQPFGQFLATEEGKAYPSLVKVFAYNTYVEDKEGEWQHSFPAIAAYITMYAREYMFWLRSVCQSKNVRYQGIDSLLVNAEGYLRLREMGLVNATELGKLKLVEGPSPADVIGPNQYRIGDKLKDFSLPSTRRERRGALVRVEQWSGLNEIVESHHWDTIVTRSFWRASKVLMADVSGNYWEMNNPRIINYGEELCDNLMSSNHCSADASVMSAPNVVGNI